MCVVEGVEELIEQLEGSRDLERQVRDDIGERLSSNQLHHQVVGILPRADLQNSRDGGVLESSENQSLL